MDKGGDTSRFSREIKHSGHKRLFSASDKSKKKRIKRLSAVNNRSYEDKKKKSNKCEMGRHVSSVTQLKQELEDGREKQLVSLSQAPSNTSDGNNKRSKLPRKQLFDESNGLYHSSVPRKLRSAMRKRPQESISPPFPDINKLNSNPSRVESYKRDGAKKSKINLKQESADWPVNHNISGPITKDEEEVAEALYALAGMFANSDTNNKSKLDGACLSASPEAGEVRPQPPEAINEEIPSRKDKTSQPEYGPERSFEVTATEKLSNDQEMLYVSSNKKHNGELNSSAAQVSLEIGQIKTEEQKPSCNCGPLFILPDLYQDPCTLRKPTKLKTSLLDGKPKIALGLTTTPRSQLDHLNTATDSTKNAFWPAPASVSSSDLCSPGSLSRPFDAKLPSWLETALCTMKPGSLQSCSSIEMIPKVDHDRKSRKRCTTHLYISRLIQVLQMPKSRDNFSLHSDQTRPNQIMNQGVLSTTSNINGIKSGLNGTRFSSDMVSAFEKHANDTARCALQQQRHFQEQKHTSLVSDAYTSQKQTFNFLSLSAGSGGLEANDGFKGAKNGLGTSKPLQVQPSRSHMQLSTLTPFSVSQCYPAWAYIQQPPAVAAPWQAQLQSPAYVSSPFHVPHSNTNSSTIQHYEQRQQEEEQWQHHQQRFRAAQVGAQYRTNGVSTSMTQYRSYQNGRSDLPSLTPHNKAGVPSLSSLPIEVFSTKYPQHSEYQQHVATIKSSLPRSRIQKRDHLSSVYEDSGGGFRAGAPLPFELLCNERP